jgi:Spy/CpxP family protein refolding chaperone
MERESRARLLSAALIAAVFGSGLLLGVAMDRNVAATRVAQAAEAGGEQERPRRTPMWEQIGPAEDQRVRIDSVLKAHRRRMNVLDEEFRQAYNPRYDAILHDTREGIKEAFTPEQAAEYQALLDEFDRRRAEERAKRNRD